MEEPAFLCQCRLVPETSEERLEKVTAIHGLSQSGPGNKPKPPSLLLLLQGPTITFLRTKGQISLCEILKKKTYKKARFNLNGHTTAVHPQTRKLELHTK